MANTMDLSDRILFEDAQALVIDKPAGLDVNKPRSGAPSVEGLASSLSLGFARWPTLVHRLDRDTSGCLLLARTDRAHKKLQQAFEKGEVQKTYIALLARMPKEESGLIDLALSKKSTAARGWWIVPDPNGKAARTRWKVLGEVGPYALVEFYPDTGRTHQLRVHAAQGLNAPIVGDPVYGGFNATAGRMMLHASRLIVARGEAPAIDVVAPLPAAFQG
jgi:tRNA pseudouridine32 synthase / 23S rRNA pseudouridine746 synthase